MNTKRYFIFTLAAITATTFSAIACQCNTPNSHDAYAAADAVFLGTVIDIKHDYGPKDAIVKSYIRIRIDKTFKGDATNEVTITALPIVGDCPGYAFDRLRSYLVYASGATNLNVGTICTHRVVQETNVIEELSQLSAIQNEFEKK